jgi:dephospho-CoA kinase
MKKDTDSSGYSTEEVLEIENEVQESFDEILESVSCDQILNLTSDMFDEKDKETVITWLVDALDSLRRSRNMLRDAASEIDLLQREAIKDKSSIILLQQKAIEENKKDIKAVESTIQTEIKSY